MRLLIVAWVSVSLLACDPKSETPDMGSEPAPDLGPDAEIYQPAVGVTWTWQLQQEVNTSYDVELYNIDLFDNDQATISMLQGAGHRVLCYFSAGSYEDWRDDAESFEAATLGEPLDGWPGERWLDVRAESVRQIMEARLDVAQAKGCDGVEPDNVGGYQNETGFPLNEADQLEFLRFLSQQAHQRGLAIALKNAVDLVERLEPEFEMALNEECVEYDECETEIPFIEAGKPVLHAEYGDTQREAEGRQDMVCQQSQQYQLSSLLLPWDLDDSFRITCD